MKTSQKVLAMLRLALGWTMFWPFLDKTFGLGVPTVAEKAWILGNSPTTGYLAGVTGPFAGLFNALSGSPVVDWLFMLGLALIGLALIFGVGMRVAGHAGALMMLLMWMASLPLDHNHLVDDHFINLFLFLYLAYASSGQYFGLGRFWSKTKLVKSHKWLE